ncbi:sodium:solute symporter family protein [Novilysobacter spongiicola]|uniref:Na+/proline symporter n=1 Tax=Lysobacter spongiicola DSM 21749 TaxID=1122188 RepID=A0A1T4RBK0_9GAMM|nr:sodium:solute symporter family protein [Lysobacter spongiicola]SKA13404.1 Na+/proline symporter [Lysobacter spongiicola DSM 21749]
MLDLLVVLGFMAWALTSGLRARRAASRNLGEYFLAGRSMPGWKSGLSMAATQFAADTPLLVAGLVASAGVFALWRLWIYALAFLLLAFVLAIRWRRAGALTDAELTELRYSGRGVLALRVAKALYYGTLINCVVMAMVLVAAVRIAEVFLPWHAWLPEELHQSVVTLVQGSGLSLGGGVTGLPAAVADANNLISIFVIVAFAASYSITGGLRAVMQTDVMQLVLALLGTAAYAWFVLDATGGIAGLGQRLVELYGEQRVREMLSFAPPAHASEVLLPFLVVVGMQWLFQMYADGTGYLAQRTMACRSDRDAQVAGVVFTWVQILLRSLLWLVICVGLLAIYPFDAAEAGQEGFVAARELTFVLGIDELMPPGARGLMLVGLLAALASTIDTHLNWGASYWSNDIYDRLVCRHWLRRAPRDRELVLVARLSNVLVLVLAIAVMAQLGSIQTAWFISLMFGAGLGPALLLRWLWERASMYTELTAMVVSLLTAPVLLWRFGTDPDLEWIRLGLMALVPTLAAVLVTLLTPPTDPAVLDAFYKRVLPSGWWPRSAGRSGDEPRAPWRMLLGQLGLVAACAASLFALLVGLGRLLLPLPGGPSALPIVLVIAGIALVPLWWRGLTGAAPDDR